MEAPIHTPPPRELPPYLKALAITVEFIAAEERPEYTKDVPAEWLTEFNAARRQAGEDEAIGDKADVAAIVKKKEKNRAAEEAMAAKERAFLMSEEGMAEQAAAFGAGVMDREQLMNMPDPEPLIEGLLFREQLSRTYGPPKSLKSFIKLGQGMCVAAGIPWAGHKTVKTKVLYIVAEGAMGIKDRVKAWEQHHGSKSQVSWYPQAVQIGDQKAMRELISYAVLGKYGFIIFDTQARCTVGVEENSNSEMGKIVRALDVLKERTKAHVSLVHHSGKEGGSGRGASGVLGAVDAEFEVKRDGKTLDVRLITKAHKYREEGADIELEGVKVGPSVAFQKAGSIIKPPVAIVASRVQLKILRALGEYGQLGASAQGVAESLGEKRGYGGSVSRAFAAMMELKPPLVEQSAPARCRITDDGLKQIEAASRIDVADIPEADEPSSFQDTLDADAA